jgi:hypothetical protein
LALALAGCFTSILPARSRLSALSLAADFGRAFQKFPVSIQRMKSIVLLLCLGWVASGGLAQTSAPPRAQSALAAKDLNTPRSFPAISTTLEWKERARQIREQILVSCGLWPMPERTPLRPVIFGKIDRESYSVEKVYFQTYPGFYLAGNLYRPRGFVKGPVPAILNPHGHWKDGRLTDTPDGSAAARCISFARQGMIAFSYDMVGYNDSHFAAAADDQAFYLRHRQFGTNRADLLWNISLMGLQTWNSIRALDFLEFLPGVDRKRLACTGESGGGTQTFILGAIDDRLAAQAPVVMVSHIMQGGCSCENVAGLRVEYSNMEIAAAAAPRPQILVAATGDWTRTTLTIEGPAIARIYELLKAPDRLRYVRFDFGHNYNQTSRQAVYDWFGRWLRPACPPDAFKERPYQKEPDAYLRVFPDGKLPPDALTQDQFTDRLKQLHRERWRSVAPASKSALSKFKRVMLPAWRHTLQVQWPQKEVRARVEALAASGRFPAARVMITGETPHDSVSGIYYAAPNSPARERPVLAILCDGESDRRAVAPGQAPRGLALALLERGVAVLEVERLSDPIPADPFANFYTTYNRTLAQQRVKDLLALIGSASSLDTSRPTRFRVVLVGSGRAGLWTLLAAPAAAGVVADCAALDTASDSALLEPDLFCPGIRDLGTFEGPAMLAAPNPLFLHHTGAKFETGFIAGLYRGLRSPALLTMQSSPASETEIAEWLCRL